MSGVVGQGERRHPGEGNTTLTTFSAGGGRVRTPLWISQFSTDLNLQIDSAQLRTGLSHRPIRLTERFLVFSTLWNVADRRKYEDLIRKIKEHWAHNLNEDLPSPMKLDYYGANKTWRGFIEAAQVGYAVTDVILTYQFQMRIIPDTADKVSKVIGGDAPYAPTSQDVKDFGEGWYGQSQFKADLAERKKTLNEGRASGNNPDANPTSTTSGGRKK